jgi:hypothetical protein
VLDDLEREQEYDLRRGPMIFMAGGLSAAIKEEDEKDENENENEERNGNALSPIQKSMTSNLDQ